MTSAEFLLWVRGPAFHLATAILVFGITLRLLEILLLGRRPEYAVVRASGLSGGFHTLFSRFIPEPSVFKRSRFIIIASYLFHLGFFITLFLFVPHTLLFKQLFGVNWPSLPTPIINVAAFLSLCAMVALLINRLTHPVLRFLSGLEDYLSWIVTFLPLLTGYIAFHHQLHPYPMALALHILSVELLMIVLPFTKLMHTFTFLIARWTTGARAAQKGVQI
jgi:nitrate reductase gamma subunit